MSSTKEKWVWLEKQKKSYQKKQNIFKDLFLQFSITVLLFRLLFFLLLLSQGVSLGHGSNCRATFAYPKHLLFLTLCTRKGFCNYRNRWMLGCLDYYIDTHESFSWLYIRRGQHFLVVVIQNNMYNPEISQPVLLENPLAAWQYSHPNNISWIPNFTQYIDHRVSKDFVGCSTDPRHKNQSIEFHEFMNPEKFLEVGETDMNSGFRSQERAIQWGHLTNEKMKSTWLSQNLAQNSELSRIAQNFGTPIVFHDHQGGLTHSHWSMSKVPGTRSRNLLQFLCTRCYEDPSPVLNLQSQFSVQSDGLLLQSQSDSQSEYSQMQATPFTPINEINFNWRDENAIGVSLEYFNNLNFLFEPEVSAGFDTSTESSIAPILKEPPGWRDHYRAREDHKTFRNAQTSHSHSHGVDLHPFETVSIAYISARERWAAHKQVLGYSPEPQELNCSHCEKLFENCTEYLEHLDANAVKHESFCPDEKCAYASIGFKYRWLLRNHICNVHLRRHNNVNTGLVENIVSETLLRKFLKYVYVCKSPGCLRAFYRLDSLRRHQKLVHGKVQTGMVYEIGEVEESGKDKRME